jgi:hypothetical protein
MSGRSSVLGRMTWGRCGLERDVRWALGKWESVDIVSQGTHQVSALGTLISDRRNVLILPSHFVMLCDISTRVCQRLDSQLNSDPLVVK